MIVDVLYLTGILLSFFTAFLIIFRFNRNSSFSGHILASYIFFSALCASFYLFIVYGVINYFPYLYKVPAPIAFLLPPLSYIYVRAVLYNEQFFRKSDIIHLLPFLFFLGNYLPFYLIDLQDKRLIVAEVAKNLENTYILKDGLLPEWMNIVFRAAQSIVYLILQWQLVLSFFRLPKNMDSKQFKLVKKWVKDLTLMQTFYILTLLLVYIVNGLMVFYTFPFPDLIRYATGFLVTISFLFISGYLLWHPKLLMGLSNLSMGNFANSKSSTKIDLRTEFEIFDAYLKKSQDYLDPLLTIHTLSKKVNISSRKISKGISQSKFENFSDYINRLRIDYSTKKIEDGFLDLFSVEALSTSSGFNSKNAFYRAFKKVHHSTPGKFYENQKLMVLDK